MPTVILHERRALLDDLAALLLVTETIDGPDLEAYASGAKPIPSPDEAARRPGGEAPGRGRGREGAAASPRRRGPAPAPLLPPAPPLPAD